MGPTDPPVMGLRRNVRTKTHLLLEDWERWYHCPHTVCGLPVLRMQAVPLSSVPPEKRCKSCTRDTKGPRYA